ncbi:MAG: hypothetical protein E7671_02180 [Ruminococcaceae bacterium]|nr:hypothetical protein [Oscillospiraceae bacterium]
MSVLKNVKICGADIGEFSLFVDGDYSLTETGKIKTLLAAEALGKFIEENVTGKGMPIAEEMGEGHYILLKASSTDMNAYSVTFEGGNVYLKGNYISIDNAVEAFERMLLKNDELSEKDNFEGSLGFKVPYNKEQLRELFEKAYADGRMTISGIHTNRINEEGVSINGSYIQDTRDRCEKNAGGLCVGILEVDMGVRSVYCKSHEGVDTLSDLDLSMIVSEGARFVNDGGIISVCIHMMNPLMTSPNGYDGHIGGEKAFIELVTEGTELNKGLRKTLEPTFRLIKALKDNGLPFMFRPLHEMNGYWFWWGADQEDGTWISSETMVNLWKCFYKMVVDELGVNNAVWVYSPNISADERTLHCYPGDEYVDIVGCDWYSMGFVDNDYAITKDNDPTYPNLMKTGKPCALCEYGPHWADNTQYNFDENGKFVCYGYGFTGRALIHSLDWMRDHGMNVAYFLNWTGHNVTVMREAEYLLSHDSIWGLRELSEYWKSLAN